MKLLMCYSCGDVFALSNDWQYCSCRETRGKYIECEDGEFSNYAIFRGKNAVPIGINNHSLKSAIRKRLDLGDRPPGSYGFEFEAWIYLDSDEVFRRCEVEPGPKKDSGKKSVISRVKNVARTVGLGGE